MRDSSILVRMSRTCKRKCRRRRHNGSDHFQKQREVKKALGRIFGQSLEHGGFEGRGQIRHTCKERGRQSVAWVSHHGGKTLGTKRNLSRNQFVDQTTQSILIALRVAGANQLLWG